jgi:radical SAM protein with 4Fe4S-binding SPASM domain
MRVDLASAHPLPVPFVVQVEPTNVCNFRCPICPESFPDYAQRAGYYQEMHPNTWNNVLRGLREWSRVKVMRFWHTGEPMLNRRLPDMIRESHEVADRTEVTSNASLLGRRGDALLASGLDHLRVSVYGTTDTAYQSATGAKFTLTEILGNVRAFRLKRDLMKQAHPHIYAELVAEDGSYQAFRDQWEGVADSFGAKSIHNWGSALVTLGDAPREKLVCPFPFYEMFVKADGSVTVCCVDWANELVIGNVNQTSLFDIWHGPRLAELRSVHLAGRRRALNACRDCNVLHSSPDNLDSLVAFGAK